MQQMHQRTMGITGQALALRKKPQKNDATCIWLSNTSVDRFNDSMKMADL